MSCPLSGQLNNLLLVSLLERSYSGHAQKLEIDQGWIREHSSPAYTQHPQVAIQEESRNLFPNWKNHHQATLPAKHIIITATNS